MSDDPKLNVCVALGSIEPVVLVPAMFAVPPTKSFLPIPTPPEILTAPVPILVLSVVPCTIKLLLACIDPATSNPQR